MPKLFAVLFLLFVSIPQAVAENEFQFVVPIYIDNVDFHEATLRCEVFTSVQPSRASDVYGEVLFTPSSLETPGEITVNVSTDEAESMNSYRCHIRLTLNNGVVIGGRGSEEFESNYENSTGRTLMNAIVVAEGEL